jgi:hypothetical protein
MDMAFGQTSDRNIQFPEQVFILLNLKSTRQCDIMMFYIKYLYIQPEI